MQRKIKRVFHPYDLWEETKAEMWRRPTGEERHAYIMACKEFMSDLGAFKMAMFRAIEEWPFSCEHNLSNPTMNRQAWIGHAACCIAIGCPEECTRQAWWMLPEWQRILADESAAEAIIEWEEKYLCRNIA